MKFNAILRKGHRIGAGLFLLAMIPAGIASAQGNIESPWIYAPLPFLFALTLSGTYMLVSPWVRKMRKARAAN